MVEAGERSLILYEFKLTHYAKVTTRLVLVGPYVNTTDRDITTRAYITLWRRRNGAGHRGLGLRQDIGDVDRRVG